MHVAPDQAMAQLYGGPPGQAAPVAELDVMARLTAAVDTLGAAARRLVAQQERARLSWEECHPVPIAPGELAEAGILQDPDRWGPRQGWAWVVTRLTGVLGAGGTAMTVYRDAPQPTSALLGPVGSGIWEPYELVLLPGQQLLWEAAGGGLVVSGDATEVSLDALPRLLMRR